MIIVQFYLSCRLYCCNHINIRTYEFAKIHFLSYSKYDTIWRNSVTERNVQHLFIHLEFT